MAESASAPQLVRAGDLDGLDRVYTTAGRLVVERGEIILRTFLGCDIGAFLSWRPVFPRRLFSPYTPPRESRLHVTTHRIVLVREIDVAKEVDPLMFPVGMYAATRRESRLREILAQNGRYYCEIRAPQLTVVRAKARRGILFTKLLGPDSSKYAVFFHTDPRDREPIPLIRSQFQQGIR